MPATVLLLGEVDSTHAPAPTRVPRPVAARGTLVRIAGTGEGRDNMGRVLVKCAVIVGLVAAVGTACGSSSKSSSSSAKPTTTAAGSPTTQATTVSVQASAPPTTPAGQDVKVTATVTGIQLVAADGDRSGKTGHLHYFVDRAPTPAGQPIPKEAGIVHTAETSTSIAGLTPGEHTVWVVVGDGGHVPLVPPAQAKVTFTVQ
jgi:hypothetical protein